MLFNYHSATEITRLSHDAKISHRNDIRVDAQKEVLAALVCVSLAGILFTPTDRLTLNGVLASKNC
jgi:hypothetical protein